MLSSSAPLYTCYQYFVAGVRVALVCYWVNMLCYGYGTLTKFNLPIEKHIFEIMKWYKVYFKHLRCFGKIHYTFPYYPMLIVSLNSPFLIAPTVFSSAYLYVCHISIPSKNVALVIPFCLRMLIVLFLFVCLYFFLFFFCCDFVNAVKGCVVIQWKTKYTRLSEQF